MSFFSEIGSRFGAAFRSITKGRTDLEKLALRIQVLEGRVGQIQDADDFFYTPQHVYLEITEVRADGHGVAVRKHLTPGGLVANADDAAPYYVMGPPAHGLAVAQSGWCEYLDLFDLGAEVLPLYTWLGREPEIWVVQIVYNGPNGEANFTDERYWVDFVAGVPVAAGAAAAYAITGNIEMVTNLFELTNHQHRLHVGDYVFAFHDELGRLVISA